MSSSDYLYDIQLYAYNFDVRKYKKVFHDSQEFLNHFTPVYWFPQLITTKTNVKPLICGATTDPQVTRLTVILEGPDVLVLKGQYCDQPFQLNGKKYFPFPTLKIAPKTTGLKTKDNFRFVVQFWKGEELVHTFPFQNHWQIASKRKHNPVADPEVPPTITEFISQSSSSDSVSSPWRFPYITQPTIMPQPHTSRIVKWLTDLKDDYANAVWRLCRVPVRHEPAAIIINSLMATHADRIPSLATPAFAACFFLVYAHQLRPHRKEDEIQEIIKDITGFSEEAIKQTVAYQWISEFFHTDSNDNNNNNHIQPVINAFSPYLEPLSPSNTFHNASNHNVVSFNEDPMVMSFPYTESSEEENLKKANEDSFKPSEFLDSDSDSCAREESAIQDMLTTCQYH